MQEMKAHRNWREETCFKVSGSSRAQTLDIVGAAQAPKQSNMDERTNHEFLEASRPRARVVVLHRENDTAAGELGYANLHAIEQTRLRGELRVGGVETDAVMGTRGALEM